MFLTGQIPMRDGVPMTDGTVEEQTRAVLDDITATLAEAGCSRDDVGQVHGLASGPRGLPRLSTKFTVNTSQSNHPHDPPLSAIY